MMKFMISAAFVLFCAAPVLAGTMVSVTTDDMITPIDAPVNTTIHTINASPSVTTTAIADDGAITQSTSSSATEDTYSATNHARPYHGRAIVADGQVIPPVVGYSNTTIVQTDPQPTMPGVMSLTDEASLAETSTAGVTDSSWMH